MNAARLPEARLRYPHLATQEDEAMKRCRRAAMAGDIKAGSQALADWVDARCAMLVYIELEDDLKLTVH